MHRRTALLVDAGLVVLLLLLFTLSYVQSGLVGLALAGLSFVALGAALAYEAFLLPMRDAEKPRLTSPLIYDLITSVFPGHDTEAVSEIVDELEIEDGMRVLEIGTGTGWFSIRLAEMKDVEIDSIDICRKMIDRAILKAQRAKVKINFECGNAEDIRYPECTFDRVVSIFNMNVIRDKNRALEEMVRVAKPGGKIAVYVPKPVLPHMMGSKNYARKLESMHLQRVESADNLTCLLIYGSK